MHLSYPFLRRLGLGAHLAVIVLLAAVPTSLLVIEFIDRERRAAIEDAETWAQRAAIQAAEHHRERISTAHAILDATAAWLDSGPATAPCQAKPGMHDVIWYVMPGGVSACSSNPDFPLPQDVVEDIKDDAAKPGFYIIGPFHQGINDARVFGALTRTASDGTLWHLVYAIDLEWTPVLDADLAEPPDLVVMAIDNEGQIIHRVGSGADLLMNADTSTLRPALPVRAETDVATPTLVDIDGVERIFGTANLPESGVTVMVGLSEEAVAATAWRDLVNSLALFAGVITLSGLIAWLVIERMILRSVRRLRDAAVATARGEPNDPVIVTDGPVELRQLADAFNEMTAKLEFQAFHDQLTGLANRRYIQQRLDALVRDEKAFAVLAIDLDGFKPINDTHGHAIGDFVLASAAKRLSEGLGPDAFIGRSGGDEFLATIVTDTSGAAATTKASTAAQGVLDVLARPITLENGTELTIGGSVGVAFWPDGAKSADEVIREADAALYRAKKSGRNCYVIQDGATRNSDAA